MCIQGVHRAINGLTGVPVVNRQPIRVNRQAIRVSTSLDKNTLKLHF